MISATHTYQATEFSDLTVLRSFDEATRLSIHWLGFPWKKGAVKAMICGFHVLLQNYSSLSYWFLNYIHGPHIIRE